MVSIVVVCTHIVYGRLDYIFLSVTSVLFSLSPLLIVDTASCGRRLQWTLQNSNLMRCRSRGTLDLNNKQETLKSVELTRLI